MALKLGKVVAQWSYICCTVGSGNSLYVCSTSYQVCGEEELGGDRFRQHASASIQLQHLGEGQHV